MYPKIFRDSKLQERFDTEGYVIIPFLEKEDVDKLTALFYEMHTDLRENQFGASSGLSDIELKFKIRDSLFPIFLPYFERVFEKLYVFRVFFFI
jgi:hypothetical protein